MNVNVSKIERQCENRLMFTSLRAASLYGQQYGSGTIAKMETIRSALIPKLMAVTEAAIDVDKDHFHNFVLH